MSLLVFFGEQTGVDFLFTSPSMDFGGSSGDFLSEFQGFMDPW